MGVINNLHTVKDQEYGTTLRRIGWGLSLAVCGCHTTNRLTEVYPLSMLEASQQPEIKVLAGLAPLESPVEGLLRTSLGF